MSSVMRKAMVYLGLSDDDYDDYGNSNQERSNAAASSSQRPGPDYRRGTTSIRPLTRPNQPTPMSAPSSSASTATLTRPTVMRPVEALHEPIPVRVHVIEPIEFADAQEIGDRLKENQPVIIVLTDVQPELARRLIDFCSGATYVLGGTMERVAKNVFLLTPSNVEVPPEEKQRLRERGLYRTS